MLGELITCRVIDLTVLGELITCTLIDLTVLGELITCRLIDLTVLGELITCRVIDLTVRWLFKTRIKNVRTFLGRAKLLMDKYILIRS